MRRENSPTGEIISFDPFDRARYKRLGKWAAVEKMPVLFDDISEDLRNVKDEMSDIPSSSRRRGDLVVESTILLQLMDEMLDVAAEEIIEAQIASLT